MPRDLNFAKKPQQGSIFEEIERVQKIEDSKKPYYNAKGEILPWEDPEYLKSLKKELTK